MSYFLRTNKLLVYSPRSFVLLTIKLQVKYHAKYTNLKNTAHIFPLKANIYQLYCQITKIATKHNITLNLKMTTPVAIC